MLMDSNLVQCIDRLYHNTIFLIKYIRLAITADLFQNLLIHYSPSRIIKYAINDQKSILAIDLFFKKKVIQYDEYILKNHNITFNFAFP